MKRIVLVLCLTGCRVGVLFEPLPNYVWACIKWQTFTVTVQGQAFTSQTCKEYGYTRKVDTVDVGPVVIP